MFRIIGKTFPFILLRILFYILSALAQYYILVLVYKLGVSITNFNPLLNTIIQPALIIIGVGLGFFILNWISRPVLHILSLGHVIAATAVTLDLDIDTSIFRYSINQLSKCFISMSVSSIVSLKSISILKDFKDSILNNDIMPKFRISENKIIKFAIKIITNDIKSLIEMVDELIVSYVWFATLLYSSFSDDEHKNTIKVQVKNQAKFMLEAICYVIKTFPFLLVDNISYSIFYYSLNFIVYIGIYLIVFANIGFNLWVFALSFILIRVIKAVVWDTLIYSFRVCATIFSFYQHMHKFEKSDLIELNSLITKIPSLLVIAKKTKIEELTNIQVNKNDKSTSSLLDFDNLTIAIKRKVNDIAKCFMINEVDILDVNDSSLVGDETPIITEDEINIPHTNENNTPDTNIVEAIHSQDLNSAIDDNVRIVDFNTVPEVNSSINEFDIDYDIFNR